MKEFIFIIGSIGFLYFSIKIMLWAWHNSVIAIKEVKEAYRELQESKKELEQY